MKNTVVTIWWYLRRVKREKVAFYTAPRNIMRQIVDSTECEVVCYKSLLRSSIVFSGKRKLDHVLKKNSTNSKRSSLQWHPAMANDTYTNAFTIWELNKSHLFLKTHFLSSCSLKPNCQRPSDFHQCKDGIHTRT